MARHLSEAQQRMFEDEGAAAAHRFVALAMREGLRRQVSDPPSVEAMQAWALGFLLGWGISRRSVHATFARIQEVVGLKVQYQRTDS